MPEIFIVLEKVNVMFFISISACWIETLQMRNLWKIIYTEPKYEFKRNRL